jgi:hypothetical protein
MASDERLEGSQREPGLALGALVQAVRAAILASAHAGAYEQVALAQRACERLGSLGGGRWRAATRELERLLVELDRGLPRVTADVARAADELGVPEDALWTAGDAAGELDYVRDQLRELLPAGGPAARLLEADILFGATIVDDPDAADAGTTLLFAWSSPLTPVAWPWEATWITGETDESDQGAEADADEEGGEELELFATGELVVDQQILDAVRARLGLAADVAGPALQEIAMAFTRASLLGPEDEEEDGEDDGTSG